MNIITITVESLGATLEGAEREDAQAIKDTQCGWRWSTTLNSWYLPRNLRRQIIINRVNTTYVRLTDAGYQVAMTVEEAASEDERHAYRVDSKQRNIAANEAKAERLSAEAQTQFGKSQAATAGIPFGQPIIAGHYSQKRHQAALNRSRKALERGSEAYKAAEEAAAKARRGRADLQAMTTQPDTVDMSVLQIGDQVLRRGEWYPIVRINKKSVTIPHIIRELAACGHTWICKINEIQAVRRDNIVIWRQVQMEI